VSDVTLRNWKRKYAGMETPETCWLLQLEEEHAQLKRLAADLTLDMRAAGGSCASYKSATTPVDSTWPCRC
jgi:hypothetical protein